MKPQLAFVSFVSSVVIMLAMPGGNAAGAQKKNPYRNYTEEKFVENMQSAGRNYAAVTNLVAGGDYESAKAQLTRAREQLAITITFWRDRQKDDAVRMLARALKVQHRIDDVFKRLRSRQSAIFGDMTDQKYRHLLLLAPEQQLRRHLSNLADTSRSHFKLFGKRGLNGIDYDNFGIEQFRGR